MQWRREGRGLQHREQRRRVSQLTRRSLEKGRQPTVHWCQDGRIFRPPAPCCRLGCHRAPRRGLLPASVLAFIVGSELLFVGHGSSGHDKTCY